MSYVEKSCGDTTRTQGQQSGEHPDARSKEQRRHSRWPVTYNKSLPQSDVPVCRED